MEHVAAVEPPDRYMAAVEPADRYMAAVEPPDRYMAAVEPPDRYMAAVEPADRHSALGHRYKNLHTAKSRLVADWLLSGLSGHVKPVLNWVNVCSPEHTSDTSTNYDSFLN